MITSHYEITEEPFENCVEIDKDVAVFDVLIDDDIIESVRGNANIDVADERSFESVFHVSIK